MTASPSGRFVAAPDRFSLWVWAAGEDGARRPVNLHHVRAYTCCAFDPSDSVLAAGDSSGRIVLYHGFQGALRAAAHAKSSASGASAAAPAASTLHWHAHAVGALAFSADGAYLLSGGAEAVLVQWQLATGKRTYLPRLGGAVVGIRACAGDPSRYLVAQADNTVRVVNVAAMRVEATVHGLRPAPPPALQLAPPAAAGASAYGGPAAAPGGCVALQPGTGHLVVSGPNALLQFFDAARERHAARLQVAPRNPASLTAARGAAAVAAAAAAAGAAPAAPPRPVEPQVVAAAFSASGGCLATVDVAPSTQGATGFSQSLKFWDAAPGGAQAGAAAPYALNTRADAPHVGTVTALAFHPSLDVAATTSDDGEFKVWARGAGGAGGAAAAGAARWRCRSVGSYKRRPLGAAAFSADGSLLAIGAGATATLWEPGSNMLVAAMPCGDTFATNSDRAAPHSLSPRLTQLAFSHHSLHLAGLLSTPTGDGDTLVVWDLLTLSVAWSCVVPHCVSLSADPAHALFAVAVNHSISKQQQADAAAAAAAAEQQQQQQADGNGDQQQLSRSQRRGQRRGCVLLFSPSSPTPVFASVLPPGAAAAAVRHVPTRTQLGASTATAVSEASPLLVVTEDRCYTMVVRPGAATSVAEDPASKQQAAAAVTAGDESVLEAVFGKQQQASGHQVSVTGDGGRSATKRVAALFDAPSHALPPPAQLCPMMLELLLTSSES